MSIKLSMEDFLIVDVVKVILYNLFIQQVSGPLSNDCEFLEVTADLTQFLKLEDSRAFDQQPGTHDGWRIRT